MVRITPEPICGEEAVEEVWGLDRGAIVTFSGMVRRQEGSVEIDSISYEAYEAMALKGLERILSEAQRRWGARLAILHRIGRVPVGEASLIVAAAAKHRREAFEACAFAVEEIKRDVPIWKMDYEQASEPHDQR